jgi:uncharacterized caspase-like protein
MNDSRCKRQVVILDCCYSGAFAAGWQPKSGGAVDIKREFGGEGRAVLTSSTALQKSFEVSSFCKDLLVRRIPRSLAISSFPLPGKIDFRF